MPRDRNMEDQEMLTLYKRWNLMKEQWDNYSKKYNDLAEKMEAVGIDITLLEDLIKEAIKVYK